MAAVFNVLGAVAIAPVAMGPSGPVPVGVASVGTIVLTVAPSAKESIKPQGPRGDPLLQRLDSERHLFHHIHLLPF